MAKKKRKIDLLSAKHKEFVLNYIAFSRNGTKAYSKTYPTAKFESCMVLASKLLRNVKVKAALEEYYNNLWESKEKEIGIVFDNLIKLASSDISNVIDYEDGVMKIKEFNDIDTSIIQQINQTVSDTKEGQRINESIKLYDKTKAISELVRILEMIQEKVTVNVNFDKESAKDIQDIFNEQVSSKKIN